MLVVSNERFCRSRSLSDCSVSGGDSSDVAGELVTGCCDGEVVVMLGGTLVRGTSTAVRL